jgi:nicotinamidase-related amidase
MGLEVFTTTGAERLKRMSRQEDDLHGNAPDRSGAALLLIDVINDLEFPGGEKMVNAALEAAERIAALRDRARAVGIPVIYANDNYGRWRSRFDDVVEHVLQDGVRGRPIAERLCPGPDDYFVLKPKHSAFFSTTLQTLLEYLGTRRLILAGFSGDICVQFTAQDAYMRDFGLFVPSDCQASVSPEQNEQAIAYMRRVLDADTTPSGELDLEKLHRSE